MSGPLGVMIIGVKGAVATTTIVGALAAARRLVPPRGLVTEGPAAEGVPLAPLERIRFGGWDIAVGSVYDAALAHGIAPRPLVERLERDLREVEVYPGVLHGTTALVRGVAGAAEAADGDLRGAAERVIAQISSFRAIHGVERVVVVNLASTEPAPPDGPATRGLAAFEEALDRADPGVSAGQVYAYAAMRAGCPYVNFTPSVTAEAPALAELALQTGVPYAGKDGKTGQTAYKATLATLFRSRDLRVRGWYSANILGNRDGEVLADPAHAATKLASKRGGLEEALGYADFPHHVRIDYYPPRGDWKEAWDVIDFEGWLGTRMTMRVNWQGEDSALAAPLVLDLARLADLAHRRGERGALAHLGFYFKSPHAGRSFELAEQWRALAEYLAAAREQPSVRVPVAAPAATHVPET